MEQVKTYSESLNNKEVRIYGTKDIGDIMRMKDIKSIIRDYEEDKIMKGVQIACPHTKSKYTEVNMLTKKGLINLIQHLRKNISDDIKII